MPINHRFLEHDFGNGFQTHNAILDTIPYEPEVLILGTFNPNVPTNPSDFFYSRNYFWPLMENVFCYNEHRNIKRRVPSRGNVPIDLSPKTEVIFDICKRSKMSFADLIKRIDVQNIVGYKDDDLASFCRQGLCEWSTDDIILYLLREKSINKIYLTRQASGVWRTQWDRIKSYDYGRRIEFMSIYTPSGQSLKGNPRYKVLLCHWLFNNNFFTYGRLSHEWLISSGVNVEKFRNDCERLK